MSTDYKTVPTCETLDGMEELRYRLEVAEAVNPDGEKVHAIHLQLVHIVQIPIPTHIPGVGGVAVKQESILTFLSPQAARELIDGLSLYLESLDIPADSESCPVEP
jgi:hypothetical protein